MIWSGRGQKKGKASRPQWHQCKNKTEKVSFRPVFHSCWSCEAPSRPFACHCDPLCPALTSHRLLLLFTFYLWIWHIPSQRSSSAGSVSVALQVFIIISSFGLKRTTCEMRNRTDSRGKVSRGGTSRLLLAGFGKTKLENRRLCDQNSSQSGQIRD